MKTIRTTVKAIFILSFLLSIPQIIFAAEQVWDFNNPAEYTISDPAKIEVADGVGKFIGTPNHYSTAVGLNIMPSAALSFTGSLSSFIETRGAGDTSMLNDVRYFVSTNNGTSWKCWEHGRLKALVLVVQKHMT